MKKIYFEPTLNEVTIKAPTILAGSTPMSGNDAGKDGNGDYNDARFDDFDWDDEEY